MNRLAATAALALIFTQAAFGQPTSVDSTPVEVRRLVEASGGSARVSLHRATGMARFVRLVPGSLPLTGTGPIGRSTDFLLRHGKSFGVTDPLSELVPTDLRVDPHGATHVTYGQVYRGLPVFAGILRTHFDPAGRLSVVNGTFLPGIDLDHRPTRTSDEAASIAVAAALSGLETSPALPLDPPTTRLVVFRAGLVRRTQGRDHLAWQVEVGNGHDVRETVFVDAHTGKIVDRITGIHEAIDRKVHEGTLNAVILWSEGETLPYDTGDPPNDGQVNGLIDFAADTYGLFSNLSGGTYLSWDGVDSTMDTVWLPTFVSCPNATWNGSSANFCDGVASDDVVGHEWGHGYTEATHGLIYQWQPGALNESYSDIFGELIDRLNGAGTDAPDVARSDGDCSSVGGAQPPSFSVLTPPSIAGTYFAAGASFNPAPPVSVTATIEQVDDGDDADGGSLTDACQPLVGFTAGNIALIDRGTCNFPSKVLRAQDAGAVGAIVVNYGNTPFNMAGSEPAITIPAVMIGNNTGQSIENELGGGVTATIALDPATSSSVRWLMGEDSPSLGGAIRDMWNPVCFGHPDAVSDERYRCSTADSGGVHTNSAVSNHAFALLADGGAFNGQTVTGIGTTKAAHVYWRAMSVYQVPDSDFADHADALAQSCADLIGVDLANLSTGLPAGETIGGPDCIELDEALLAVEMADDPPCSFGPLLAPSPPPLSCGAVAFHEDMENDPTSTWILTNVGVFAEYTPRDWVWDTGPPEGGTGSALFAVDSLNIGNCVEGDDDQSGMMSAETPPIALGGEAVAAFDHWVATELRFDGGNVRVSVNGGPYALIGGGDFTFNTYNQTLIDAESGNTNPMAGEEAFTGSDGGEVTGSWGQSQIDLSSLADPGDAIRLRFDLGVDGCNGLVGWYVDNVRVCTDESGAGRIPDGGAVSGTPLEIAKSGGEITLSWDDSCGPQDIDFEIYEGTLGSFAGHEPRVCSTAGASTSTLVPATESSFYLVVPASVDREGSYGTDSAGNERPQGIGPCLPQALAPVCW